MIVPKRVAGGSSRRWRARAISSRVTSSAMKSVIAAHSGQKRAAGVAETISLRLSPNGVPKPIVEPMPIFEQGDIVRVPFPYTDRDPSASHGA
jgi:hypothetical protein